MSEGCSFLWRSLFCCSLLVSDASLVRVPRQTGTRWSAEPQSSGMTELSASGTLLQSTTSSASRWAEEGSMWCCLRYLPRPLPLQTRCQSPSLRRLVREGENAVCELAISRNCYRAMAAQARNAHRPVWDINVIYTYALEQSGCLLKWWWTLASPISWEV